MPSRTALRRVHRRRDRAALNLRVADPSRQLFRTEVMGRMLEAQHQQANQRLTELEAEAADRAKAAAERREARSSFGARQSSLSSVR